MSHTLQIYQKANPHGCSELKFNLFDTETGKELRGVTNCSITINAAQQPLVHITFIPDELDIKIEGLQFKEAELAVPAPEQETLEEVFMAKRKMKESQK